MIRLTSCTVILSALALSACTPITPSGDVFAPVDIQPQSSEAVPSPTEEAGEEAMGKAIKDTIDSAQDAADDALFGPVPEPTTDEPDQPATEEPNTDDVVLTNWGYHLVSTINDANPPRALLSLSTGEEVVVRAGQLLPQANLVILAIGQDTMQVATVTPDGDRAIVTPETLTAFQPNP